MVANLPPPQPLEHVELAPDRTGVVGLQWRDRLDVILETHHRRVFIGGLVSAFALGVLLSSVSLAGRARQVEELAQQARSDQEQAARLRQTADEAQKQAEATLNAATTERTQAEEAAERLRLERRKDNPFQVLEYGVTDLNPDTSEEKLEGKTELGLPVSRFYVYTVVRNNLYELEDQHLTWSARVKGPVPLKPAFQREWKFPVGTSEATFSAAWEPVNSTFPPGDYEYHVECNGRVAGEGTFRVVE